jgi:hypothetical protein
MDGLELTGRIRAIATRICGVSLNPFDEVVEAPVAVRIVPPDSQLAPSVGAREVVIELEGEDPPDVLEGDAIDVGAYIVEHLALALTPFPRKPGVVFEAPETKVELSPFSVLRDLSAISRRN